VYFLSPQFFTPSSLLFCQMKTRYIVLLTIVITILILVGGFFGYNQLKDIRENFKQSIEKEIKQETINEVIAQMESMINTNGYLQWDDENVLILYPINKFEEDSLK